MSAMTMLNDLGNPIQQVSLDAVASANLITGPLFILAAPRSFTSVVCTMLGQHPQMYGLPELHLFGAETMGEWWEICERTRPAMPHGALRAVAELFYGKQTEHTITLAAGWLRRRSHYMTGFLLESL